MKLYYNPLSTYSQKVLLALYEKGLEFDGEVVNLFDEASRDEYRALYPIGKIPLLVLDDGYQIPESSIIVEYLDTHHPRPRLIPDGADEARRVRFMDRMNDLYVNNQVAERVFESWKPEDQQSPELIQRCEYYTGISFAHLDQVLANQTWLAGEQFTLADCALVPPLFYAREVLPFDDRPNLAAYFQRACERPSYQRVLEELKPALEAFEAQRSAA